MNLDFVVGDLFHMPIAKGGVDCVVTMHAIEPNTSREEDALKALAATEARYLVLFEPDYFLGNAETRQNIEKHKYIKDLAGSAKRLGMKILDYRLLPIISHTNNTSVLIIENSKEYVNKATRFYDTLGCPVCGTKLINHKNNFYCDNCCLIYPIINGIPVMVKSSGILASKYLEF